MKRLSKSSAPSGAVFDWSGGPVSGQSANIADEKATFNTWASQLNTQSAFKYAVAIDNAGWGPCGSQSSQTPTCVEQLIENSLNYEKTATTSTYVNPKDGITYNGGGYFPSAAYLKDPSTGQPAVFMWFNGESNWFGSICTSGSPCAVYNAGTSGTTCTSSSDCWTKVKTGIHNYTSSWSTSVKPEFFWQNTFSNNSVTGMNAGAFSWQKPTSDGSNEGYDDSDITTAATSSLKFVASATPHLDHAQSSFQDDNYLIGDRCGQTWLNWLERTSTAGAGGLFGPGGKALWVMEVATWNDHEEGTVLEPGVGNCYGISASIASGTVSWTLSTSNNTLAPLPLNTTTNNTLDHIALLAVRSGGIIGGKDTQVVATASPASSGTFNMSTIHLDSGSYSLYVKLVPRAGIQTKISSGLSFTK